MLKKTRLLYFFTVFVIFSFCPSVFGQANNSNSGANLMQVKDENAFSLTGEWEFYPNKLLTPVDLQNNRIQPSYIQAPSSWENELINGKPLNNTGYGTYRTQFKIQPSDISKQKALSLYYIGSAYRLWINGDEYPGLGAVGKNKEEEVPQLQRNLVFFEPKKDVIEIVIQVSNHSFRDGGIISDIVYGEQDYLIRSILIETFLRLMIVGGFFVIGLYHVLIFVMRKNELAILFVGLASLAVAIRTLFVTEFVVNLLFPLLSWEFIIKIEYLSEIGLFVAIVMLINSLYPKETHQVIVRLAYLAAAVVALLILFTQSLFTTSLLPYHMSVIILIMLYFIFYVGTMAAIRKREGAVFNLIGIFVLLVASAIDGIESIINVNMLHSFYMIEYAFIVFIMLQAIVVSNRYARLFKENVTLNEELLVLNQSLEATIEERTKELDEKNKQLVRLQQARTEMLSNIAHDIGSPLIGIQVILKIMKQSKAAVDINKFLPQIIEKIDYIQKLNNNLFELSKLESQQLSFNCEKVEVNEFFTSIYESLEIEKESENMTVSLGEKQTTLNNQEIFVQIDKLRIRQVIQNFVDNAVKFNSASHKKITLHCYINDENEVVFEVEDNGIGVPSEEIRFIFDRFYKKSEGNPLGSGLGLAIVKAIIEQHGGRVGVISQEGEGSRFYFALPVLREN